MARTRSDFLTRAPIVSHGGDSDEDDYDGDSPLSSRHYTLPLSKQSSTEAGLRESCFSDSDMVTGAGQANSDPLYILKACLLFEISNPLQQREHRSVSRLCLELSFAKLLFSKNVQWPFLGVEHISKVLKD